MSESISCNFAVQQFTLKHMTKKFHFTRGALSQIDYNAHFAK